jgi:hypothetical protein
MNRRVFSLKPEDNAFKEGSIVVNFHDKDTLVIMTFSASGTPMSHTVLSIDEFADVLTTVINRTEEIYGKEIASDLLGIDLN